MVFGFSSAIAGNCNPNTCCPGNTSKTQAQNTQQQEQQNLSLNDALNQVGATDFAQIVQKSGAEQMFAQSGPYTIFAPSNAALNGLSGDTVAKLKDNPDMLKNTMENHIVQGAITQDNITSKQWKSLSGQDIKITTDDQGVSVNGQRITKAIQFKNGVVYLTEGLMLPPAAM